MQQDVDSAAISETTAPLAPPAPLDVVGTATNGVGGHRRHRLGGRSRSWGNDADVQCHDDREDDDDDDAVLRHTPIMTRFTPLPDLHQRELQQLALEASSPSMSKARSFPKSGVRRRQGGGQRVTPPPPAAATNQQRRCRQDEEIGTIRRSRSKSLGNEHERIVQRSHVGYGEAEARMKKSKSYGGVLETRKMAEYMLSKYGRNVEVEEEDEASIIEEEEDGVLVVDESTYLLVGSDEYDGTDHRSDATASQPIDSTDLFAEDPPNPPSISIAYGLINSTIVLPVLISFGSIIYHDDFFRPYMPLLVKLTVVSGTVHQICFSTFSSLPFAVGQVQDAGLIFLSKMASDIVRRCREDVGEDGSPHSDEEILATATIGLALCTALLGLGLVVIGYFRLASTVQLLPTPVVGGYLAFIGFFCGQGGLSIMAGFEVSGLLQWGGFFSPGVFKLIVPGILCGIMIYLLVRQLKSAAVLPACIVGMMLIFYTVLLTTGTSLDDARDGGWLSQAEPAPVWYQTWAYLKFNRVVWSALPPQIPTLIGMIFVVALSSSLDVAAIELELKKPLNYNHELKTVGISNVVSGLTGGYTGSYIFSQSIFSLRAGIRSRLSGYCLALSEAIVTVLPVNFLSYVPLFFFGSLLVMISVDLVVEWLWEVRLKMTHAEYGVAVGTFALIMALGVEWGILAGIVLYFAFKKMGLDMGGRATSNGTSGIEVQVTNTLNGNRDKRHC